MCKYASSPDMNNGLRILKLYLNYWLIFLIFIPLACYTSPSVYPNGIVELVLNFVGISFSYNGAWWFLLPYIILVSVSSRLIHFLSSCSVKECVISMIIAEALSVTGYILVDFYRENILWKELLVVVLNTIYLLFMFVVGILFSRYKLFDKIRIAFTNQQHFVVITTMILIILKLCIGASSLIHPVFVVLLLSAYVTLKKPLWFTRSLQHLGKHSTNIWLLHYFFITVFCREWIYSFKYPMLIFVVLFLISYISSVVIKSINQVICLIVQRVF